MSDNRDTQFRVFAKLLLDELCEASIVDIETPFNDDWREEWEETIAQRAYDLVRHAIKVGCTDSVDWVMRHKLDLTEWPMED